MDEHTTNHIEQVRRWLEKNVQHYPTPRKVTLSAFEADWDELSGSFRVDFDGVQLPDRLKFGLEASGKTTFYLPMFVSPLGAPASYGAIEITDKAANAISKGLHDTIPRLKGCGTDRETGEPILFHTPVFKRIKDLDQFEAAKKRVAVGDYSISIDTDHA